MKTIAAVDTKGHAEEILRLIARLAFEHQNVELLNVVDTAMPIIPIGAFSGAELSGEYMDALRTVSEETLHEAKQIACSYGISARATLVFGPPSLTLLDYANEHKVDLICVRASLRGPFGSFVYGSVSRALTIGAKQSVLVAKGEVEETGPVRAVLAVDHSDYCDRCVDKLISLRPQGFEKVCVLTAFDPTGDESRLLREKLAKLDHEVDDWIEERLAEKSKAIVAKLANAGIQAEHVVERGHPNDAIRAAMHDFGADLLILGAHGHGFLERLVVGSVSLHQVVAEAYSTLLIRV